MFSKKSTDFWSLLWVFMVGVLLLFSCKEKGDDSGSASGSNEMGKNVFNNYCASCHGPTGKGDGPASIGFQPRDFTKDEFKNGDDLASIIETLNTGIANSQMVSFKGVLSEKQIEAVAKYVRYLGGKTE